jgi:hypothetical protein
LRSLFNGKDDMSDKTKDTVFENLATTYEYTNTERKRLEKEEKNLNAQILRMLGNSIGAYTNRLRVKATPVEESQGTLVTPEMVGTYVGKKRGHYKLYVKALGSADGKQSKRSDQDTI